MKNSVRLIPVILLLSVFDLLNAEDVVEVVFVEKAEEKPIAGWKPNGGDLAHPSEETLIIRLAKQKIETSTENRTIRYDFENKLIWTSAPDNDNFEKKSLYSVIGYRSMELPNRESLKEVLNAGGLKKGQNVFSTTQSEHLFSLKAKTPGTVIKKESDSETSFFDGDGKLLTKFSKNGMSVNRRDLQQFILLLRYRYGIHPDVLAQLSQQNKIPNQIEIISLFASRRTFELALQSISRKDHLFATIEGTRIVPEEMKTLFPLAHSLNEKGLKKRAEKLNLAGKTLVEEGRYLDGMATFLEATLMTGGALSEEFQIHREKIVADPDVILLFQSVEPTTRKEAEVAVESLAILQEKAKSSRHTIGIFHANIATNLHRPEAARGLIKALEKNPYLVGVWKDLGNVFHSRYKAEEAWLCWEIARKLQLNSKFTLPVNEMEESLEKNYPDFFLLPEPQEKKAPQQ